MIIGECPITYNVLSTSLVDVKVIMSLIVVRFSAISKVQHLNAHL
jgi:hypothetical protein